MAASVSRLGHLVGLLLGAVALAAHAAELPPPAYQLAAHGVSWWLGTCVIGLGAGVFMLVLFRERARRAQRTVPAGTDATGTDVTATG